MVDGWTADSKKGGLSPGGMHGSRRVFPQQTFGGMETAIVTARAWGRRWIRSPGMGCPGEHQPLISATAAHLLARAYRLHQLDTKHVGPAAHSSGPEKLTGRLVKERALDLLTLEKEGPPHDASLGVRSPPCHPSCDVTLPLAKLEGKLPAPAVSPSVLVFVCGCRSVLERDL